MASDWISLHSTLQNFDTLADVYRKMKARFGLEPPAVNYFLHEVCGSGQVTMVHGIFTSPRPIEPGEIVGGVLNADRLKTARGRAYDIIRIHKGYEPLAEERFGEPASAKQQRERRQQARLEALLREHKHLAHLPTKELQIQLKKLGHEISERTIRRERAAKRPR